jgi:hypothetical protein
VEHQLDPRWITLARRQAFVALPFTTLLWAGAITAAIHFARPPLLLSRAAWYLFALKILFNVVKSWYWPTVQYRHQSWKVDDNGIQIREGVVTRHVRSVPRSRVQHIDLSQGFFERGLGLATVTIHTAGRSNAAVGLDGVTRDTAASIRDYLLPRSDGDAV